MKGADAEWVENVHRRKHWRVVRNLVEIGIKPTLNENASIGIAPIYGSTIFPRRDLMRFLKNKEASVLFARNRLFQRWGAREKTLRLTMTIHVAQEFVPAVSAYGDCYIKNVTLASDASKIIRRIVGTQRNTWNIPNR